MTSGISAGFVPLIDAAPLVVAREKGFAATEGIALKLVRQASWACLRDHLNLGHIDCAQALAPLPIAAALGVGQVRADISVPMVLSRGGNAITLSSGLVDEIRQANHDTDLKGARAWARAFAIVVRQRREPVTLAMVYPFSGHNFEIRYWLASAGVHPDRDVRLIAIPPPLMVESLRAGQIDGFCVGAPWNSIAVIEGLGEIVATKSEIFPHGIEKVLAVPNSMLADESLSFALIRALVQAARWCDKPENFEELAALLARDEYVGTDPELSLKVFRGKLPVDDESSAADYLYFSRLDANRPRREDALWIYAQMLRWGQFPPSRQAEHAAAKVYRPELFSRATGVSVAAEVATIAACDRVDFRGQSVSSYLQSFEIATPFGSQYSDL